MYDLVMIALLAIMFFFALYQEQARHEAIRFWRDRAAEMADELEALATAVRTVGCSAEEVNRALLDFFNAHKARLP